MIWNAVHKAACIRASGSVCLNPCRWTQDRSPYLFHFAGSRVSDAYLHYNSTFHLSKKKLSCWKSGGVRRKKIEKERKKGRHNIRSCGSRVRGSKIQMNPRESVVAIWASCYFPDSCPQKYEPNLTKIRNHFPPPHISFPLNTAYTHFVQGLTNLKLKACLFFRLNLKIADELSSVKQAIVSLAA